MTSVGAHTAGASDGLPMTMHAGLTTPEFPRRHRIGHSRHSAARTHAHPRSHRSMIDPREP